MQYESNDALVRALVRSGAVRSGGVRSAFEAVDRASYLPPPVMSQAYHDAPVLLKRDAAGVAISTVSQPTIVALMLEQLGVARDDRVLEVGTASGYNAALLAHLVGERGLVVTVEVDEGLARAAARRLAHLPSVRVIVGDGRLGHRRDGPYNGIIVTAGAPRVEPAWVDQLTSGGRLVVPITGDDRRGWCVTYERSESGLVELASMPCGFVPLR